MLIFFEGHDKSGKTSIAKSLVQWLNSTGKTAYYIKDTDSYFAIKHNSNVAFCSHIGLYGSLFFPYIDPNIYLVIDRYVLSEIVYSKVFNRVTDDLVNLEILNRIKDCNGLHVICYKTGKIDTDEIFSKQDEIRYQYSLLKDYNILHLDTTNQDLNTQLAAILNKINLLTKA